MKEKIMYVETGAYSEATRKAIELRDYLFFIVIFCIAAIDGLIIYGWLKNFNLL